MKERAEAFNLKNDRKKVPAKARKSFSLEVEILGVEKKEGREAQRAIEPRWI